MKHTKPTKRKVPVSVLFRAGVRGEVYADFKTCRSRSFPRPRGGHRREMSNAVRTRRVGKTGLLLRDFCLSYHNKEFIIFTKDSYLW